MLTLTTVVPDGGRNWEPASHWWYGVAAGVSAWTLFLSTLDLEGSLGPQLSDTITLLALLAWPLIPVTMYLDLRAIRGAATWRPARKSWVLASFLPIANVPAGLAYCLRRGSALRGEPPSANWRYAVYLGFLGWIAVVAADVATEYASIGPLEPVVFGPILLVVWLGFPVALYLDAERVRAYTDLSPNLRVLVALSAVPLLNLLVGGLYLAGRWWHRRKADPDAKPTLPGSAAETSGRAERLSPWYRRAVAVYVVYFLAVVALGSWLSLASELSWDVLALVLWPAFGVVFTACYHCDRRDLQGAGLEWGWTRYAYYLSAVVPALAFWYLLSRYNKVRRARSDGTLGASSDGGGDGNDGGGGSGGGDGGSGGGGGDHRGGTRPAVESYGFEWVGEADR